LMLKCIQQNHPHFIVIWETTWVSKAYLIKISTLTWSPNTEVVAWEIWRNQISNNMRVNLCYEYLTTV
jgi:hypothetical protein